MITKGKIFVVVAVLLIGASAWKFWPSKITTIGDQEETSSAADKVATSATSNIDSSSAANMGAGESSASAVATPAAEQLTMAQAGATPEPPLYDREVIQKKRAMLKQEAEKMRTEMMKKLQQLNTKGKELDPEVVLKELYKDDDPTSYSPQKKAYLEEIAKPFMMGEMEGDDEFAQSGVDLTPVMSKAYDLLEKVDKTNLQVVTNSFLSLPKPLRENLTKGAFKDLQQKLATMSEDESENVIKRLQDSHDERASAEIQNVFDAVRNSPDGEKYMEDTRKLIISTAQMHLLNK